MDHNNSYGEKSHYYITVNNHQDIYFVSKNSNIEFVIKQREGDFLKLTEGFSLAGAPGKRFETRANGMITSIM